MPSVKDKPAKKSKLRKPKKTGADKVKRTKSSRAVQIGATDKVAIPGVENLHTDLVNAAATIASTHGEFAEFTNLGDIMAERVKSCNLPAIKYRKMPDGSWLECYLQSDCSYAGCKPVAAPPVPQSAGARD